LQWEDAQVLSADDREAGLQAFFLDDPDIVLLDVAMPAMDGFQVLKEIRRVSDTPVSMLTAQTDDIDQVRGLELGADDYVQEPFSHVALMARIKAVLMRAEMPPPVDSLPDFIAGGLAVHFQNQEVSLDGEPLRLTPVEYKLLYHLVRNAGHLMPHQALLDRVWGSEYQAGPEYLKVFISRLRAKLRTPDAPEYIETERGRGYRFVRPRQSVDATDQQRAIADAEDYLTPLAEGLSAAGLKVQTGVPFGGSVAEWIIEESDMRGADLIIMATHDRLGPDRWVHGSVPEGVVHRTTTPVMLVRGNDTAQIVERFSTPEPVLIVPLDCSPLAEASLPTAAQLAIAIGARIVLVSVVPSPGELMPGEATAIATYSSFDYAELEAEARAYLETSVRRLEASGIRVETVVRSGQSAVEIALTAREYTAAAVVMATHGRTGLMRSILGSVAGGVLHYSTSPVVLVRPAGVRGAEQPFGRPYAVASAV
jgi:two-component system, OmpR family, KDP operon response regulator KdpE